ncbi:MAG: 23S rRNA (pseudouridine(1915)-N(3))-methyltransferase RlmH [Eggerthellaceae bacterium]|nr:23S rRNA (pseudouridine(1915)-N(3))-methyltransferase RlmH [Eggerthellaceae bacterium]
MNIFIIAVGKLKENFWKDACAEYLKRLGPYAKIRVVEVTDASAKKSGEIEKALKTEELLILRELQKMPSNTRKVLLDLKAKEISSEALAEKFGGFQLSAISNVAFIIGASNGVSEKIKATAEETISFGPITLPHNLARVVLLEQIYRAFKILRGEPYQK